MLHRLAINGLDYVVFDEGDGPCVLLVHGFPDDHEVWRKQVPALVAAGCRVIAPDMRGCGETAMAARVRDYKLPLLVADLAAILDALGVARVRLVGHDWGSVIAWHFCFTHPDRVERFAALSVGHPNAYARAPIEQKLKSYYVLVFQLRGLAEWLLTRQNWWAFRKFAGQPDEARRWIARLSRPGRLSAAIAWYRANPGLLFASAQPRLEMPILGLFSDGDRYLCEAQMRKSARYVAGPFRVEVVPGAGHWLQLDAPERVNALLIDFMKEDTA